MKWCQRRYISNAILCCTSQQRICSNVFKYVIVIVSYYKQGPYKQTFFFKMTYVLIDLFLNCVKVHFLDPLHAFMADGSGEHEKSSKTTEVISCTNLLACSYCSLLYIVFSTCALFLNLSLERDDMKHFCAKFGNMFAWKNYTRLAVILSYVVQHKIRVFWQRFFYKYFLLIFPFQETANI